MQFAMARSVFGLNSMTVSALTDVRVRSVPRS